MVSANAPATVVLLVTMRVMPGCFSQRSRGKRKSGPYLGYFCQYDLATKNIRRSEPHQARWEVASSGIVMLLSNYVKTEKHRENDASASFSAQVHRRSAINDHNSGGTKIRDLAHPAPGYEFNEKAYT
ncbi:uncharacterized protein F5147DRAFT_654199 [Suillus discolor]|uniref:Uncharacterized protein n=1 Tax=Suillus discolor TaxID=1912936 RepID=A0A9P7F3J2_9AGAM|nr:uncharacterized protein F5147DRAFT_654199 [Suillus discolor]KAG2105536.1 hypothetical protein F5147DRAFT_654199 [Suillus discolor]